MAKRGKNPNSTTGDLGSTVSKFGGKMFKWGALATVTWQVISLAIFCMTAAIYGYPKDPLKDRQPGAMQGLPPDSNYLSGIPAAPLASIKSVAAQGNVPWEVPTAIIRIQSNFGKTGNNYAGLTSDQWLQYCEAALGDGTGEGGIHVGGGGSSTYQTWLAEANTDGSAVAGWQPKPG